MQLNESAYYDGSRALSYHCPITMICGQRSLGKTYWFKRLAIKRYIDSGKTWAYMRRYDEQIKAQLQEENGFFSDIIKNGEFPDYELRQNGRVMEIRRPGKKRFETFGHFFSLNAFENKKGSNAATMWMILFDEFIKSNSRSRYLPNELDALANVWETFDRKEDRVRIVMLGNLVDMLNPYFLTWGIALRPGMPEFTRYNSKTVLLHMADASEEFAEHAEQANITRVFGGSRYDKMNRQSLVDNISSAFIIRDKPATAQYMYTLSYQGDAYAVWLDANAGEYYVTAKRPKKEHMYALTREDMRPNMIMVERAAPVLKTLARMYRYGYCFFNSERTRERVLTILQLMGAL